MQDTIGPDGPRRYGTASDLEGRWNLWFRLCEAPDCACRDVLVLATREERDLLEPVVRRVEEAWREGGRPNERAAALTGVGGPVIGFSIDIDTAVAAPLGPAMLDPRAAGVAAGVSGEVLDDLHRRWCAAKGLAADLPSASWEASWKAGDLVAWGEVFEEDRVDVYVRDHREFLVDERYCIVAGCACNDLFLGFVDVEAAEEVAWLQVDHRTGAIRKRGGERADLWEAYVARHPRWRQRAADRQASLRVIGARIAVERAARRAAPRRQKVGRNDDCPCGSGRKYKKCCAPVG
jgi:hypothetical protein